MKTLKHKIKCELHKLEKQEVMRGDNEISHSTLKEAYELAKTFCYLHKFCEIMQEEDGMDEVETVEYQKTAKIL